MSRTSTAKSRSANVEQIQPTPISKPEPHARQPYPLRDLTREQERLIGAFADMLQYGPARTADLDAVLAGLLNHEWHMWTGKNLDPSEKSFTQGIERWKASLLRATVEPPKPIDERMPDSELTASISEHVRANLRQYVAWQLEKFVLDCSPEELHIMREILNTRDGSYSGYEEHEIAILSAFQEEVDGNHLMKVPERFEKSVRNYLDRLLKAERGEDTGAAGSKAA